MSVALEDRMKLFKKYLDFSGMEHKPYQYEGVQWCVQNETRTDSPIIKGGFIADEMGLGKTILMIGTFIAHFVPKTLVVVPVVLLDQWYQQIYKTTGHKAVIYHGVNRWKLNLDSAIIVITTYDMIAFPSKNGNKNKNGKEKSLRKNLLHLTSWDRVVFDEGHHLRNKKTLIYSGAMLLKSSIRWIVSGTPVQNKKQDFYHLCGVLGMSPSFYENFSEIQHHYILKRTKKQIGMNISDVSINHQMVDWKNKGEKELSQTIHSYLSFSNIPTNLKHSYINSAMNDNLNHLVMIMKARQCCILPRLIASAGASATAGAGANVNKNKKMREALAGSSKMDSVIEKLLERKNNGNGKLVFCHFKEEIDELHRRLISQGFLEVQIFDGRLNLNKRKEILLSNSEVLILQIQTGCEGLNLQENYSEIYFVSPHWNPAIEDQAIARCHRIGQKKQVEVYKFTMASFIEEEDSSDSSDNEELEKFSLDAYVNSVQDKKRIIASEMFV